MKRDISHHSALFLVSLFLSLCLASDNTTGSGVTSRYWDCCKPSCGWKGKGPIESPVLSCDIHDNPLQDFMAGTGCNDGTAYACTDQSPWAVNDTFSYGFAGVYLQGHVEDFWCCACYQLTFTSGPVKGKTMIVQAHNTAYDVTTTDRFALAVPGGNTSYAGACAKQFGVPNSVFGQEMVGVASRSACDNLPEQMKAGCQWRFDWFENADRPLVDFKRVACPTELTNITQCVRDDDKNFASTSAASQGLGSTFRCIIMSVFVVILGLALS